LKSKKVVLIPPSDRKDLFMARQLLHSVIFDPVIIDQVVTVTQSTRTQGLQKPKKERC